MNRLIRSLFFLNSVLFFLCEFSSLATQNLDKGSSNQINEEFSERSGEISSEKWKERWVVKENQWSPAVYDDSSLSLFAPSIQYSKKNLAIVFDLDNTIFPTSAFKETFYDESDEFILKKARMYYLKTYLNQSAKIYLSLTHEEIFASIDHVFETLLQHLSYYTGHSDIYLISNGSAGWIKKVFQIVSTAKCGTSHWEGWFESCKIARFWDEKVHSFSARDIYPSEVDGAIRKQNLFNHVFSLSNKKYDEIISIGDGFEEWKATHNLGETQRRTAIHFKLNSKQGAVFLPIYIDGLFEVLKKERFHQAKRLKNKKRSTKQGQKSLKPSTTSPEKMKGHVFWPSYNPAIPQIKDMVHFRFDHKKNDFIPNKKLNSKPYDLNPHYYFPKGK